jgi:putative ABC transport system substrate-binding protein
MTRYLRRREFITLIGGAAAAPLLRPGAARAQQLRKIPRIGLVDYAPTWEPLRQGLRDLGYIEGQTIAFEHRFTEGMSERFAAVAAELVRLPADVIVLNSTPQVVAAKRATATIPIVMIGIGDPVRAGLVASIARPGGNVTGNTVLSPEVTPKRVQVLKELVPSISRLALLWNPDNASNTAVLEELQLAGPALGVTLISVPVNSAAGFDTAFAAMMKERPDALFATGDPFLQRYIGIVIGFLAQNRLPGMYLLPEHVAAGGLISYGASLSDLFRRGATYVHKILQGAKPADLPVEQPTTFELVINLKTAKALGLTIPESFLLRADKVIE